MSDADKSFGGNVLSSFNPSTMELILGSATSISYKSGPFSGYVMGPFAFDKSGDLVGGNIKIFAMFAQGWSLDFTELDLPAIDFTNTLVSQGALPLYKQALAGDDVISVVVTSNAQSSSVVVEGFGGNDQIFVSGGINTVFGGAGNDRIVAQDGTAYFTQKTYMRGEEGNDTIVGGFGFDDINGNQGDDICSGGDGNDWVVGGQGDDLLYGGRANGIESINGGNDIVYGNLGNDTCYGGDGADWVRGGQGDDVLYGEAGNDWMAGDRGNDTLSGGAGADVFYGFKGIGLDRVTDFSRTEGDRIQLAPGTAYTLRQDGSNAVIDLGDGDQIVLVGVQSSSLSGDWLFFA